VNLLLKFLLWAFQIGRLAGIPIKVHVALPIMMLSGAWMAGTLFDAGLLLLLVAFMLACITLHELGHALVAVRKGCHIVEILLTPIGGVARIIAAPLDARDETQIAIAGPLVSLGLALIFLGPAVLTYFLGFEIVGMLFGTLCVANLIFFLFNLIPAFPMDGGRILRAWLSLKKGRLEATRIASLLGRGIAVLFLIAGWMIPHFPLMMIAFFVYFIANFEYTILLKHSRPRPPTGLYDTPLFDTDGLVVSEAPYEAPRPAARYHLGREILTALRILKEEWPRLFKPHERIFD
jgi:Zn-dependent protease